MPLRNPGGGGSPNVSAAIGLLPIANGGTNSNTALSGNAFVSSQSGALKEQSGIYLVQPSAGGAGIQSAINTAGNAGGGIIQLFPGTYSVSTMLTWPSDLASNVHIVGCGRATVIDSTVPADANNLPQYIFDFNYLPPTNVRSKTLDATTKNSTSVTTSTHSDAAAFTAGMRVLIIGTDANSEVWQELNEVLTTGNGTSGVIALKGILTHSLTTSVSISGYPFSNDCSISNMKFVHSGGSSHALRINGFWNYRLENCYFDGTTGSQNYALDLLLYESEVLNNTIENYNNQETGTIAHGTLLGGVGNVFRGNKMTACSNTGKANRAGLNIANCFSTLVEGNFFESISGNGIRVSNASSSRDIVLRNNQVHGSSDNGIFVMQDTALVTDIDIVGNHLNSNGLGGAGSGLQANASRMNILDNNCNLNVDEGISLGSGATLFNINNNICRKNTDGIVLVSATNGAITGNMCANNSSNGAGIYVQTSTDIAVNGNMCGAQKRGIFIVSTTSDVQITGNNVRGTGTAALEIQDAASNINIIGNNFRGDTVTLGTGTNIVSADNMT